jgi:hypothetical protein
MNSAFFPLICGVAFVATTDLVSAHHSFSMFDQEHPLELSGMVKEFRFTNPHSFIRLEVKDKSGNSETWTLEGSSPSGLAQDGWTSKTLKTGDELRVTINPARNGAPRGAWDVNTIMFKDGKPIPGPR